MDEIRVAYEFPDGSDITISDSKIIAPNTEIGDMNNSNAVVLYTDQEYSNHVKDVVNQHKAEKAQQIIDDFKAASTSLVAGYTQEERDSFAKQEQQALAFNVNPDETRTDLVMLKNMATQRDKTMQQVADRILLKAAAFEDAFGDLLGTKQAREDALAALGGNATIAQVEAI